MKENVPNSPDYPPAPDPKAEPAAPSGIFTDALGTPWKPVFTVPVIQASCRGCGLTIAALVSLNVNLGDLVDVIRFACEEQAKGRQVTRAAFLSERLTPAVLPQAVSAVWAAVGEAFPQVKYLDPGKGGGSEGQSPFGLGNLRTLLGL